jgi:bacterioferritin
MAQDKSQDVIRELVVAYWMEMETTQNYIANAANLDGVRAEEIKKSLAADITEELTHAQRLATRVRELGGKVPGSLEFKHTQVSLQPPADSTNVVAVIKGVIAAEDAAIQQYKKIIRLCEGEDYVTQDLCIQLLAAEESHRREFRGFLAEYEKSQ